MRSRTSSPGRLLPDGTPLQNRLLAALPAVEYDRIAQREVIMDPMEAQARATIAAALIVRGAVEVPAIPSGRQRLPDDAGVRLRELTDYVYRLVTTDHAAEPE